MRRKSMLCRILPSIILGSAVLLALLGPALQASPAAAAGISRDEAVTLVVQTQLGGSLAGIRLYVDPRMTAAGETVSTWRRDVFTAPADGWFVFVNRFPGANWEHPCWYFFVDAASGAISRFDAMTPPRSLAGLIEITRGRDNPPPGVSEAELARFSERLRSLPKPTPARAGAWALIISGGADASNNHIRYWNDCAFIYRTLVEYYGYADDHIRVLMSDGTNPAPDRSNGTNSPTDLDGDGDADTEYPATLTYVDQVFNELAATLTADDQLFIFTTDHGGQESGHDCYLNLWNLEELRDDQMAAYVAALPCAAIICTFEQCFSGGMVDDLQADGRVIATAANWDEYSWAMGPDYIYDTFVYHWTSAVAWQNPNGNPVDADTNNDGIVSMREAFLYAQANDHEQETPQYSSTPLNLGDWLNLFGNLEGVYLTLNSMTIDDDNAGASHGDGDGVIDFGETIELTAALHNIGLSDAQNVGGTLVTSSPHVTLLVGSQLFGTIPAGGTTENPEPFVLQVANDVEDQEPLDLTLNVTENPGALPMELSATAPSYLATVYGIDDAFGDQDGMADPGELVGVALKIENRGGCETPELSATLHGGQYLTTDESLHHVGVILSGHSEIISGFTVQVSPDCPEPYTGHLVAELTGPESYDIATPVTFWVGPWFDDAELDIGWTLGATGDNATTGIWERADPVGTTYSGQQCQPEDDHTPMPGHICFVTGNGTVGGAAGDGDVDGGKTTLLSPVFDTNGASSATITYWRWYTNSLGNNPNQDYWDVDVTTDGASWVHLEHTTSSANSWTEHVFNIADYVPLAGSIQFRFVADDESPGSLVEAAVDDITISISRPTSSAPVVEHDPIRTGLGACRPNPSRSGATLTYRMSAAGPVRLEIYDTAGRRVRTLLDGTASAGEHTLRFETADRLGRRLASGVYFVRLETRGLVQVKQIAVLR